MSDIPGMPAEVDPPGQLRADVIALRDRALEEGRIDDTVLLSHVIAWLGWAQETADVLTAARRQKGRNG